MKNFISKMGLAIDGLWTAIQINFVSLISNLSGKKTIIFQLHAANQIPHIRSIVKKLSTPPLSNKFITFVLVVPSEITSAKSEFEKNNLDVKVASYYSCIFLFFWDVVVAIDQRMRLPISTSKNKYRLCMFHGQPTKGNVYSGFNFRQFDGLCFYGPMMRDYYFSEKEKKPSWPDIPTWDIGQPKSDELFVTPINRFDAHKLLKLDPRLKSILYAPSFENCASMAEHGEEIINCLSSTDYNLVVKPHPTFYRKINKDDPYSHGMVHADEWRTRAADLRATGRVVFEVDQQVDTRVALSAADILITDHSGIAFEAILLDKPVIYFDCPRFFDEYLPRRFGVDGAVAKKDIKCNAGRDAGIVVDNVKEMLSAVEKYLVNPALHAKDRKRVSDVLLFNKGRATEAFLHKINEITE